MPRMHLIVTAAGDGTRFSECGLRAPKPVIDLLGRPFFQWAAESVRRRVPDATVHFVTQSRHDLGGDIRAVYPDARVLELSGPTAGAAETAWHGAETIADGDSAPVGFLDCDLAFDAPGLPAMLDSLTRGDFRGALCVFSSRSPNYSYVVMGEGGTVSGTVEKKPVSDRAIAGLYLFANAAVFRSAYREYRDRCPYKELFMSGLYDVLAGQGRAVGLVPVEKYVSFGTPEEYRAALGSPHLSEYRGGMDG